jgi:aryl-alcohol dehydrogenase-like predicted oxidoreductase
MRPLGPTGVNIAPLVLGAMNFGAPTPRDEAIAMIDRAIGGGVTLIDTADVYVNGVSEQILGDALASNGRREDVLIATKVGMPRAEAEPGTWHRREHIVASCERSLESLKTDRIDLYQLHRPSFDVPQEETLAAMDELVTAGKVRFIGASTYPAWKVMEGLAVAREQGLPSYVSEQPPYNLLDRRIENELVPLCREYDLAILPWSPLAAGILAGRYDSADVMPDGSRAARVERTRARVTQAGLDVARRLGELAGERGLTTSQLALLWVKDQPGITAPIVGPRTMAQLDDALGILGRTLDDDARASCDELVHPGNAVSDFHNTTGWIKSVV